ncbi:hypothetical protein HUU59_00285 [bacterium]|nr:hypothetical protein [bacterium]
MKRKKSNSALHDLFVAVRRVILLTVSAFALAMNWPLDVIGIRILILWAILAILTHAGEVLFQYLSHRAILQQGVQSSTDTSGGALSS